MNKQKIKELKRLLYLKTGCEGPNSGGWTCNSCFHNNLELGITDERLHQLWESVLMVRGDYNDYDFGESSQTEEQLEKNIDDLVRLLNGSK